MSPGNWDGSEGRAEVAELDAEGLLSSLTTHGVEFVVIGGLAVAAHGYVRATKDLDITPAPGRANLERLFVALQSIGAAPIETADFTPDEIPVPFEPEGLEHGGNWALRTRFGRIDVLQWVEGVDGYEQLRANAFEAHIPDVGSVRFAGYDDLIAMKTAAGRDIDRADIARLSEVRAET